MNFSLSRNNRRPTNRKYFRFSFNHCATCAFHWFWLLRMKNSTKRLRNFEIEKWQNQKNFLMKIEWSGYWIRNWGWIENTDLDSEKKKIHHSGNINLKKKFLIVWFHVTSTRQYYYVIINTTKKYPIIFSEFSFCYLILISDDPRTCYHFY